MYRFYIWTVPIVTVFMLILEFKWNSTQHKCPASNLWQET